MCPASRLGHSGLDRIHIGLCVHATRKICNTEVELLKLESQMTQYSSQYAAGCRPSVDGYITTSEYESSMVIRQRLVVLFK